jgi:pimeloyl-ACP methyl ester carboxylesterase
LGRAGVLDAALTVLSSRPEVSAERARTLTIGRPIEFAKRWLRWFSGDTPRNADDEVIWSALYSPVPDDNEPLGLRGGDLLKRPLREDREAPHYVILIHGIRTTASWQEMLKDELKALKVEVKRLGYGWLDVVRFWLPWTRRKPITLLESRLIDVIREARRKHPAAAISVVAHSFGTYALAKILLHNPLMVLHRVVLCGSIVPMGFAWEQFEHQITGGVVNDVGVRDIWPVLAQAGTWGYGASGTFGFKHGRVEDRNHDLGHSGYFTREFVKTYWLPWLDKGDCCPNPNGADLQPRYGLALLSLLPLQWSLLTLLGVGLGFGILSLVGSLVGTHP